MKVEIDLTEAEARMMRSFCLLRPMNAAAEMLLAGIEDAEPEGQVWTDEDRVRISEDLHDSAPVFERVRQKLVDALYIVGAASRA